MNKFILFVLGYTPLIWSNKFINIYIDAGIYMANTEIMQTNISMLTPKLGEWLKYGDEKHFHNLFWIFCTLSFFTMKTVKY